MVVIVDTSALNYLILIGAESVLVDLYGEVIIPEAVLRELEHADTPIAVTQWMQNMPAWLE